MNSFNAGQYNFDFKNALGATGQAGSTLNATVTINGTSTRLTLNSAGEFVGPSGPSGSTYSNAINLNSGLLDEP